MYIFQAPHPQLFIFLTNPSYLEGCIQKVNILSRASYSGKSRGPTILGILFHVLAVTVDVVASETDSARFYIPGLGPEFYPISG